MRSQRNQYVYGNPTMPGYINVDELVRSHEPVTPAKAGVHNS
jgi:hypothetical protein